MHLRPALLLLVTLGLPRSLPASIDPAPDASIQETGCFMTYVADEDPTPRAIPLETTEVVLDVKPGLLEAEVIQTFVNRTGTALEATYQYPLPDGATLTDFELRFDDHILRSRVKAKQAARASYEEARDEGRKAALLERSDPSLFQTSVANFMPGETVRAVIRFIQPTTFSVGAAEVRFPMVSGVKYLPATAPVASPEPVSANPARLPAFGPKHYYAFDIEVAGFPPSTVTSPSHAITVENTADGRVRIALAEDVTIPDRDFRLRIEPLDTGDPLPALALQHGGDGEYGLLTLFPPVSRPVGNAASRPRDIMFLLDRSGSMNGARFSSAKLGLDGCLQTLLPGDRFQIATFESSYQFATPDWQSANDAALADARRYVQNLPTGGGTEMQPALAACLARFQRHPERDQFLIFLTDGDVGNEESLFKLVRQKIGDVRLFAFGIGEAPNARLINRMAELGGGQARFISNDNDVARELEDLFATLDAPLLSDLHVELFDIVGDPIPVRSYPDHWGHLFLGRPLQMVFRCESGRLPTRATIDGFEDNQPVRHEFALNGGLLRGAGITRFFGGRVYAELEDRRSQIDFASDRATVEKEMLETALQYQLVTEFTSRVAVAENRSRDPDAPLATTVVGQAMPGNLGGTITGSDVIVLSPFEVSAEESSAGYTAATTLAGSRMRTELSDVGNAISVITSQFMRDVTATEVEDLLTYDATVPRTEDLLNAGATKPATIDGLPITTVLDLATVQRFSFPEGDLIGADIALLGTRPHDVRELLLRVDDDGLAAGTLTWGGSWGGGNEDLSAKTVLNALNDGQQNRRSGYLAVADAGGSLRWALDAQANHFSGYGETWMTRASSTFEPNDVLTLQLATAWHTLHRNDPGQFSLDNPAATYDGLGSRQLDLLTAETTRLKDGVVQAVAYGHYSNTHWSHHMLLTGEWHHQEADWTEPATIGDLRSQRDNRALAAQYSARAHRLGLFVDARHEITHAHESDSTTPAWQSHTSSLGLRWSRNPHLKLFAQVSEATGRAWVTSGRYRPTEEGWQRIAQPLEHRRELHTGLQLRLFDGRLETNAELFQLRITNLAYRDWTWEQQHPSTDTLTTMGDLRRAISYAVWPKAEVAGFRGALDWIPIPPLTLKATWNVTWTNDGPYGGGDYGWSMLARYDFSAGWLRGIQVGGVLRNQDALQFNDGYRLGRGTKVDLFLVRRWENPANGKAIELRLNLKDLTDQGGAPTRFAVDRGRRVQFSLSQEF